jgi:hypothetical protein
VHPVVDALAASLTASAALEDSILGALCCVTASDKAEAVAAAVAAAAAAQDWRLRLEAVAASNPGQGGC